MVLLIKIAKPLSLQETVHTRQRLMSCTQRRRGLIAPTCAVIYCDYDQVPVAVPQHDEDRMR